MNAGIWCEEGSTRKNTSNHIYTTNGRKCIPGIRATTMSTPKISQSSQTLKPVVTDGWRQSDEREAERGKVVKVRTERATLRLLILIVATFPLSTRSIHVLPSPKYSMKKQLTSEPESPHPSVRKFKDRLPLMYVHKRSVYFRTGLVYTEVANRFRWPEVVFVQRFKNWTTTHRRWYSSGTRSQMW